MKRLKAGDFIRHTGDSSIGLILGTGQQHPRYKECLWIHLFHIWEYKRKSLIKIRKTKKLLGQTKETLLSMHKNKQIDNLTYIENLDILK